MVRRSDHSREEIRAMALDAAEAMIASEGFAGVSTRKIANAIGYTVGTLYLIFDNLADLLMQVNGRTLDHLHTHLRQAASPDSAPCTALLQIAHAYIAYARDESPRWNMLFEHGPSVDDNIPDWYQHKLARVFSLVEAALTPFTRDELETQQIARILWSGVHGICTLRIRHRMSAVGNQSAEEMADIMVDNFLKGLRER